MTDLHSALTTLTRLAQRCEKASGWLEDAVGRDLEKFSQVALDVAVETGDPMGWVLARLVRARASLPLIESLELTLQQAAYSSSVPLWEVGLAVQEKLLDELLSRSEPADRKPETLARLFNNRAVRLSDLGRDEEALRSIQQSVELFRELAANEPAACRPGLAISLDNLGTQLSRLGRKEEGLAALEEAILLRRTFRGGGRGSRRVCRDPAQAGPGPAGGVP